VVIDADGAGMVEKPRPAILSVRRNHEIMI